MTLRPNGDYGLALLSKRAVTGPVFVAEEAGVAQVMEVVNKKRLLMTG